MIDRLLAACAAACALAACNALPDRFSVETPAGRQAEAAYQRCLGDGVAASSPTAGAAALDGAIVIVHACRREREAFEAALVSSNVGMRDAAHKADAFVSTYERASVDRVAAALAARRPLNPQ